MGLLTEIFEVEVQLENLDYVPLLSVEATFRLSDDGPEKLSLDLICEITDAASERHNLIFTTHEIASIRYAVADAIERKYWSGEYRGTCA